MNTETDFDNYIFRLKARRNEDNYTYTDDDFIKYESYIRRCFENNLSSYKCLEFMYYETLENETPVQRMMGFILDKFEKKLSKNVDLSQELDSCFETVLDIEKQKMKEFYLYGVSKGRTTLFFNVDESFEKTYYKIFPDE
jgi:hypothetical protein